MKKFLVIFLSVVMLFSTLLLCGFASPEDVVPIDESVTKSHAYGYSGTPLVIGQEYTELFFNTDLTTEQVNEYLYNALDGYRVDGLSQVQLQLTETIILGILNRENEGVISTDIMLVDAATETFQIFFNSGYFSSVVGDLPLGWQRFQNPYPITFTFNVDASEEQLEIVEYYLNVIAPIISTTDFIKPPTITGEILTVIDQVFIQYPVYLVTGILSMFSGLFWQDGALTIFGYALITLLAIAIVGSIFYTVYRIFKGKIRKRL